MSSSDVIAKHRRRVLDQARKLARSGRHADHKSIIRAMESAEGFALAQVRFQERAFLAQLDRMCRMARETLLAIRGPTKTRSVPLTTVKGSLTPL